LGVHSFSLFSRPILQNKAVHSDPPGSDFDSVLTSTSIAIGTVNLIQTHEPRGKLLVLDDEEGPRESMRVIFQNEYDLFMAEDGPTAIKLAQENDIDVAVLDIRMAVMSGLEVLERLKILKPDIEVIMMSGSPKISLRLSNGITKQQSRDLTQRSL
jgi:CheY-like chemotaxis protein